MTSEPATGRGAILPDVDEPVANIAALLRERNEIDARIAKVINRPVTAGPVPAQAEAARAIPGPGGTNPTILCHAGSQE